MAKASTDFKPVDFEREVNGKTYRRTANTPADAVQFRFDGWRQVKAAAKSSGSSASTSSTSTSSTASKS